MPTVILCGEPDEEVPVLPLDPPVPGLHLLHLRLQLRHQLYHHHQLPS